MTSKDRDPRTEPAHLDALRELARASVAWADADRKADQLAEDLNLADRACARALERTPSSEPMLPLSGLDGEFNVYDPDAAPIRYVTDKEKKALLERREKIEHAYIEAAADEQSADERMRVAARAYARAETQALSKAVH